MTPFLAQENEKRCLTSFLALMLHGRPLDGHFEYSVGVFDNANYEKLGAGTEESDELMMAGRVVAYLLDPMPVSKGITVLSNGYADYKESYLGEGQRLGIGANYAYLGEAFDTAVAPTEFDLYAWGVDVFYNSGPWVLQAEYDWFKQDMSTGGTDLTGDGWYVQGGYLLGCIGDAAIELAARHQQLNPEDASEERLRWTSIGLNVYIHQHNLKVQTDYTWKDERAVENDNDVFQVQLQLDF